MGKFDKILEVMEVEDFLELMETIGYKKLGLSAEDFEKCQNLCKLEIRRRKLIKSSGYKKIENYMKDLSKRPEFLAVVKEVRKKYDIPENGFGYSSIHSENAKISNRLTDNVEFVECVKDVAEQYGVSAFREFIGSYFLFNNFKLFIGDMPVNVIKVLDMSTVSIKQKNKPADSMGKKALGLSPAELYPVGILIHPYMSQRDILDAIKMLYKSEIEPLQKKYQKEKIKLGKVRKKSERVEERNKFIYENRLGKSRKELVRMVNEKFGEIMDYTYINRIIKEEREKNK